MKLKPIDREDYRLLIEFLGHFPGETRGIGFWKNRIRHWWEVNPICDPKFERGWLLIHNQAIVGLLAVIPVPMLLAGQKTRAIAMGIWRVIPEHQSSSMKLFYKCCNTYKASLIISATYNPTVEKIQKAYKFRYLPGPYYQKYGIVLNMTHYLRLKFSGSPLRFLTPLMTLSARIIFRLTYPRTPLNKQYHVFQTKTPGPEIDELWQRTLMRYQTTNIRNREVLAWYCNGNPEQRKNIFTCKFKDKITGYAIFWEKNNNSVKTANELKVYECLDLWVDVLHPDSIQPLLKAAEKYSEESGCDLLVCSAFNRKVSDILKSIGFKKFSGDGQKYMFSYPGALSWEDNSDDSYFVLNQGDYSY